MPRLPLPPPGKDPWPHRSSRRKRRRSFHEDARHGFQPTLCLRLRSANPPPIFALPQPPPTPIPTASVPSPGPERQAHLRPFETPLVSNSCQRRQRLSPAVSRAVPLPPQGKRLRHETLRRLTDAGEGARA